MVGFMLYVCGRLDPTEFFYGMRLSFPEPPHLAQLKRSIESKVLADSGGRGGPSIEGGGGLTVPQSLGGPGSFTATYGTGGVSAATVGAPLLPDGSSYVVADLEILDFRLNEWVPLESRAQLYSGCQITAIRDATGSATAGTVDAVTGDALGRRALGFALEAETIFRVMDYDSRGAVTLSHLLRVLRHDVNYAVDLFSLIDYRGVGAATLQDFIAVFRTRPLDFWRQVQQRLAHGGRADGVAPGQSTASALGGGYQHPGTPTLGTVGPSYGDSRYGYGSPGPSPTASPSHRPVREPTLQPVSATAGRGIAAELNAIMTSSRVPARGEAESTTGAGVFAALTPDRRKQMLLGQALSPATPPPAAGSPPPGGVTSPNAPGANAAGAAKTGTGAAPTGRLSARVTEALLSHLKRHQKGGASPTGAPPDPNTPLAPGAAERAAAKLQRAMLARKEAREKAAVAAAGTTTAPAAASGS
jgi:hypothetical protein